MFQPHLCQLGLRDVVRQPGDVDAGVDLDVKPLLLLLGVLLSAFLLLRYLLHHCLRPTLLALALGPRRLPLPLDPLGLLFQLQHLSLGVDVPGGLLLLALFLFFILAGAFLQGRCVAFEGNLQVAFLTTCLGSFLLHNPDLECCPWKEMT